MVNPYASLATGLVVISAVSPAMANSSANIELFCGAHNVSAVVLDAQAYAARKPNLDKLDSIGTFERNWNGYGAPAFGAGVIETAKIIVAQLTKQPEIFPTGRGTVQMEYHQKDGTYLEFEVFADRITVVYISNGDIENAKEDILSLTDYTSVMNYVGRLS